MSKIGVQQLTLCYNLNHFKIKQVNITKKHIYTYRQSTLPK